MSPITFIIVLLLYFSALMLIGYYTGRKNNDNKAFFAGNHNSLWYVVAFGMIGASISGVSVISLPGMVRGIHFNYLQTTLGFVVGYVVVAFVLLPLYYKLNLTSIYGYLGKRFSASGQKTGSFFFVVAKIVSSASKLYVAVLVLQSFVLDAWNIPLWLTVCVVVLLIWLYTHRGGIRTIVWTDSLQTLLLLTAVVLIAVRMMQMLDFSLSETVQAIHQSPYSKVFEWNDWNSTQYFWKQFLSGIFIVIVMTGLDQDMMQKNLSCRNLRESQINMMSYGVAFIPVNLLLMSIGVLFLIFAQREGIVLPESSDQIMPFFAQSMLGPMVSICFIVGIIAASFSSADSALTSITTAIVIDLIPEKRKAKTSDVALRRYTHIAVCIVFIILVLLFANIPNKSILDTIFIIVGYAYGPLLGLFTFGLLTKLKPNAKAIPYIAILSPSLCYIIDRLAITYADYHFGYELLMLNGAITFLGLLIGTRFVSKTDDTIKLMKEKN